MSIFIHFFIGKLISKLESVWGMECTNARQSMWFRFLWFADNDADAIRMVIRQFQEQTYPYWELIIVDSSSDPQIAYVEQSC